MHILSASAVFRVLSGVPYGTRPIRPILFIRPMVEDTKSHTQTQGGLAIHHNAKHDSGGVNPWE